MPTVIWASVLMTNVTIILFEEVAGPSATPQLPLVILLNLPWLLVPIAALIRMWRTEHPFSPSGRISPEASAVPSSALPVRLKVASPFRHFLRGQRSSALFSIFPQLFLLVEFMVLMLLGMSIFTWLFLLFLALLLSTALWRFVALTRLARPTSVEVSQEGLSWRIGRRGFALPWEEARGWAILNLPEPPSWSAWVNQRRTSDSASALYALIGEHATLVWTQQSTAAQPASTNSTLSDFVTARVAIPLRDLTEGTTRLSAEFQGRTGREREMAFASDAGSIPGMRLLSMGAAGIFLTLSILVTLAAILTPFAQQQYFGGQLQQLEATHTQARDPLTSDTLGWTPAPPGAADGFAFSSSGYVFAPGGLLRFRVAGSMA